MSRDELAALLMAPEEALRSLPEHEQRDYLEAQQSVMDARRRANALEGERVIV